MKMRRILTTVLALCFVVTAFAGIASARDIGNWDNLTIASNYYFEGKTTRTRSNKEKAVINVRNDDGFIRDTGMSAMSLSNDDPTYINDPAGMYWRVLMYRSGKYVNATSQKYVFNNDRQTSGTYYYTTTKVQCKLELYNGNSFVIKTQGTWCPDEN